MPSTATSAYTWTALVVVAVVVAVLRLARLDRIPPRVLALLAMVVSFWALTAVTRGFLSAPYTSRYLYVGALFFVLVGVELFQGVRVPWRIGVVLAVAVGCVVVSNVRAYQDGGRYLQAEAITTRARLAALDIARAHVRPDYSPNPIFGIHAGTYFAAERAWGTPAFTTAGVLAASPTARSLVDGLLSNIYGLTVRVPAPSGGTTTAAPQVDASAGGSVRRHGGCVTFTPSGVTRGTGSPSLEVQVPSSGVVLRSLGGQTSVGVRRFGDGFQELGTLAGTGQGSLRIPSDRAPQRWRVRLSPTARVVACGARQ